MPVATGDPLVDRLDPRHHHVPGELARSRAAGLRERRREVRLDEHASDRRCQGGRVRRRDQQAVHPVADHLAVAGDVRRHHRNAGGERLDEHDAEALVPRGRRGEHVRGGEVGGELDVRDRPEHQHARSGVLGEHVGRMPVPTVPGDDEGKVGELRRQTSERPHHDREPLLRIQAADPEQDPAVGKTRGRRPRLCEALDVDAVGDDLDPAREDRRDEPTRGPGNRDGRVDPAGDVSKERGRGLEQPRAVVIGVERGHDRGVRRQH